MNNRSMDWEYSSDINEEFELNVINDADRDDLVNTTNEHNLEPNDTLLMTLPSSSFSSETNLNARLTTNESFYKNNDIFKFLNAHENLEGRMILGKYRLTKTLDYSRLKEMLIFYKLKENPVTYKIKSAEFIKLRDQLVELFPTEDKDLFYIPAYRNAENEGIGARGNLYNCYKYIRKQFKVAGLLNNVDKDSFVSTEESFEEKELSFNCLTDPKQGKYSFIEIIRQWELSFDERLKSLSSKKKKGVSLRVYFDSFPCLCAPIGISLLESDFQSLARQLHEQNSIDEPTWLSYGSLFSDTWPKLSSVIIEVCKKSRIKDVKDFLTLHKHLLNKESCRGVLALLLLPLCTTVTKVIKTDKSQSTSVSKAELTRTFILHVKDSEHLEEEKDELERWLTKLEQEVHPYVIFCGKVDNITQAYVIINSEKYAFTDPIKAIEACYKCLTALGSLPNLCDYVWIIINKLVYKKNNFKSYAAVSKFIVDINKSL